MSNPPLPDGAKPDRHRDYYKLGTQRLRKDGKYVQCGYQGCLYSHKDWYAATGPKHYQDFHGFHKDYEPTIAQREANSLAIDKDTWIAQKVQRAVQGKHLQDQVKQQNHNAQAPNVLAASAQAHNQPQIPAQGMNGLFALGLNAPPFGAPYHAMANQAGLPQQNTVATASTTYACYICSDICDSKEAVELHAYKTHRSFLDREPFQPDRIMQVTTSEAGQLSRQFMEARPQLPTFLGICPELRELILQRWLTVPTSFSLKPEGIDPHTFLAFSMNKQLREQALKAFSRHNFIIQFTVHCNYMFALDCVFPLDVFKTLPLVPRNLATRMEDPALTIDVYVVDMSEEDLGPDGQKEMVTLPYTLVYTERGFIDFVGCIQRMKPACGEVRYGFASHASDPRYRGIKETTELFLGFLRGVGTITRYQDGEIDTEETGFHGELPRNDDADLKHQRRVHKVLHCMLYHGLVDLAGMVAVWMYNHELASLWERGNQLGDPTDGDRVDQITNNAEREMYEEGAVLQLELEHKIFTRTLAQPDIDMDELRGPYRSMITTVFNTVFEPGVFCFPGIPDTLRARAHATRGRVFATRALWLLSLAEDAPHAIDELDEIAYLGKEFFQKAVERADEEADADNDADDEDADAADAEADDDDDQQESDEADGYYDDDEDADETTNASDEDGEIDGEAAQSSSITQVVMWNQQAPGSPRPSQTSNRTLFRPHGTNTFGWRPMRGMFTSGFGPPDEEMTEADESNAGNHEGLMPASSARDYQGDSVMGGTEAEEGHRGVADGVDAAVPAPQPPSSVPLPSIETSAPYDWFVEHPDCPAMTRAKEAREHLGRAVLIYDSIGDQEKASQLKGEIMDLYRAFGREPLQGRDGLPLSFQWHFYPTGSFFVERWEGNTEWYPRYTQDQWIEGSTGLWANMGRFRERPEGWDEVGKEVDEEAKEQVGRIAEKMRLKEY